MKKIFLGGPGSCDVHFDKYMIYEFLDLYYTDYELTDKVQQADLIVIIDTCIGTYNNLQKSINYIERVIDIKKENAQVIVSGCLTKGVNFELDEHQKSILKQVTCIKSSEITEYICKILKPNLENFLEETWLEDFSFPYEWSQNSISFSIVEGCSNHCSFCKTNYMNFPVKSIPFEKLEKMVIGINELNYPFNYMDIYSSNVSLYGIDLYNRQRSHEAIKLLTSPECVKFIGIGCLINFYPELIKEIIENTKIKNLFISLESGSERIYNLMNRPISLTNLVNNIKIIKQYRPDIIIKTEIICGFPTETLDDLKRSIELVQELDIIPIHAHPYIDSPQIESSKQKQHSFKYNIKCSEYLKEQLSNQYNKYHKILSTSEMIVIDINEEMKYYTVIRIDGSIAKISFDNLNRKYNVSELIEANTIISKQVTKRIKSRIKRK